MTPRPRRGWNTYSMPYLGGDHKTGAGSEGAICSGSPRQAWPYVKNSFRNKKGEKKKTCQDPRAYILPRFIIVKLIISKTLKQQGPWKTSAGSLECARDLLVTLIRAVSRWEPANAPLAPVRCLTCYITSTKSPRATGHY